MLGMQLVALAAHSGMLTKAAEGRHGAEGMPGRVTELAPSKVWLPTTTGAATMVALSRAMLVTILAVSPATMLQHTGLSDASSRPAVKRSSLTCGAQNCSKQQA